MLNDSEHRVQDAIHGALEAKRGVYGGWDAIVIPRVLAVTGRCLWIKGSYTWSLGGRYERYEVCLLRTRTTPI